jgi:aerobic-type carbon monoxide dehydrogenase small subunit (CoxS/CutS family)
MPVGRIQRAGRPHARIVSLDTSRAEALACVRAVLTHRDIAGQNAFGIMWADQPALCHDVVRDAGDPVAAVAALARAVHVVTGTYTTPRQMHAFLETEGGWCAPDGAGGLTVAVGGQPGARDREQLARILAIPEARIRVISSPIGVGFGGKDELTVQPALALLALKAGAPVRLHTNRAESILGGLQRNPMVVRMTTGVDAEGRLCGHWVDALADCGAYASLSAAVLETAMEHAAGPYQVADVETRGRLAYTNNGLRGAFRGFGANQMTFAIEAQMDRLAAACGLDPADAGGCAAPSGDRAGGVGRRRPAGSARGGRTRHRRGDGRDCQCGRRGAGALAGTDTIPAGGGPFADGGGMRAVAFTLNGAPVTVEGPPDRTMTAILRDDLCPTGTTLGCGQGRCGACMVLQDGAAVNGYLVMGWQVAGRSVTTIEGLRDNPGFSPLFDALAQAKAAQCGCSAPGSVVALAGLVALDPGADGAALMAALDGHLRRCKGHRSILSGPRAAVTAMRP